MRRSTPEDTRMSQPDSESHRAHCAQLRAKHDDLRAEFAYVREEYRLRQLPHDQALYLLMGIAREMHTLTSQMGELVSEWSQSRRHPSN